MVRVIDTRPGAGKTSYAVRRMRETKLGRKIMYVTPFLMEVERIATACPERKFRVPSVGAGKGSKARHLRKLLERGENVVITHNLFAGVTEEMLESVKRWGYELYVDEAMSVLTEVDLYEGEQAEKVTDDMRTLIRTGVLSVDDETGLVRWTDDDDYLLHMYDELKGYAERKSLYYVDGKLLWCFPVDVFCTDVFEEVTLMTYQFEYQMQSYYFRAFNVPYEVYTVYTDAEGNYNVRPKRTDDLEWRRQIAKHIRVCGSEKLNAVGDYEYGRTEVRSALCKEWYRRATPEALNELRKNIDNFLKNISGKPAKQRMWTSYKVDKSWMVRESNELSRKNWVALNSRATNKYIDKDVLVYPINVYPPGVFNHILSRFGFKMDTDGYAIAEFLQWLFRSKIRVGGDVDVYLPSRRMRDLLKRWVEGRI